MRNHQKRLDKVNDGIQAMRITPGAADAALEQFRETGELPEHERLAERTIERALRLTRPKSIREMLFFEAVHAPEPARLAAREVLTILARVGLDVTSRDLVDEDMELPEFGTVGMHMLGWPDCLAVPPYEDQARRLFDRLDVVRRRVTPDDERWFQRFAKASAEFLHTGELPQDDFMRDAVLVYGELLALGRVVGDEGDAEVLEAFDQVAQRDGEERAAAIKRLQALAAAGRIP